LSGIYVERLRSASFQRASFSRRQLIPLSISSGGFGAP
jgi:hypothetical protein